MDIEKLFYFIAWLCVTLSAILVLYYYYTAEVNLCTSDPLSYGLNKIKEDTDATLATGTIYILLPNGHSKVEPFGDINYSIDLEE